MLGADRKEKGTTVVTAASYGLVKEAVRETAWHDPLKSYVETGLNFPHSFHIESLNSGKHPEFGTVSLPRNVSFVQPISNYFLLIFPF